MTTTHSPLPGINHSIPFRQPAITAPLNWGFGAVPSSTLPLLSASSSSSSTPLVPKRDLHHFPQHSSNSQHSFGPSSFRSRKRCASEDMDHDSQQPNSNCTRPTVNLSKRIKASLVGQSVDSDMNMLNNHTRDEEIDLGKAIFSLTKPELVALLHNLIDSRPELKSTIQSLLPPPTLDSIINRLNEAEAHLLEITPNKRMNRDEYVWNRIRVPLNGYVNDCLSWLKLFDKPQDLELKTNAHGTLSDQFTLLSKLSLSIKKIEGRLPVMKNKEEDLNYDAYVGLRTELIPKMFESWKKFVETIHAIVFIQGIILSESLIRRWFNQLDELATLTDDAQNMVEKGDAQRLMEIIRDEARLRFGDLVGLRFNRF